MHLLLFVSMVTAASAAMHPAHLSKEQADKVRQFGLECMKETGVKKEVVAEAKKGNFADDEALKKFTLCFFQKTGILTADGKLNEDVALAKLPAEVDKAAVKKVLDVCKNKIGKDKADSAFEIFKCYFKAAPMQVAF